MQSSSLECRIHDVLVEMDIPFEEEYVFDDLYSSSGRALRFDFACFDDVGNLDFLIEAQGEQHYHPVKRFGGSKGFHRQRYNDNLKRQYCNKNRIQLIAIPYFDESKVNAEYIMRAAGY